MQKKFNICFILLILLLCIGGCAKKSYLSSADNSTETNSSYTDKTDSKKSNTTKSSSERLVVQVAGAVNSPGVYELDSDARVFQAILMAGGFREDADDASVNQASKLSDGQKLVILTKAEAEAMASSANSDGKIDINTADEATLMTLPGIGQSKAGAIIKYRESNGPFAAPEDIKNISGIKDGVYSKIEDKIKV